MAVLIKKEIIDLAEDPDVKLLGSSYKSENVKGCSYDLRIGTIFKNGKFISLLKDNGSKIVDLLPSEIITILTYEVVNIPAYLCGTVFSINKNSSSGFLILNPGHIDPGFLGPISICAINLSNEVKHLNIGEPIFTIYFHKLTGPTEPYISFFSDRSEYEIKLYKERFSKLSPSFFDLMKMDKYKPHLVDLIKDILNEKSRIRWEKIKNNLGLYLTIIGGIITIIIFVASFKKRDIEDLKKEIKAQKETIEIQKTKIDDTERRLILYVDSLYQTRIK